MQEHFTEEQIEEQRKKVFGEQPYAQLVRPCRIGDGILRLEADEKNRAISIFERYRGQLTFFIPASGSGSRMVEFLHEYRNSSSEELTGKMELFINHLEEFAFFKELPEPLQQSIVQNEVDIDSLVDYLLDAHGLDLSSIPKGLIPFHYFGPFILNAFQEHLLQGNLLSTLPANFHFTIQKDFEEKISQSVENISKFTGITFNVRYSEQSARTNSVAFNEKKEPYKLADGSILTRPSGHGALLPILNTINSELILVKNIDNVQHFSKAEQTNQVWRVIAGVLLEFRAQAQRIFETQSTNELFELNKRYQLFNQETIAAVTELEAVRKLLDKPVRVCGMVRNEGQPGGGPFWVMNNGKISKQIVEKAQISMEHDQRNILLKSTHFNPVMMALCPLNLVGEKFDITQFKDENTYFIVHKSNNGENISYMEQPGLWNGSMADWITLFVETPSETFSPVKSLTDLIDPSHRE